MWWCFCVGVVMFFVVVWWRFCGGVVVFLWWRGGFFVVAWWCFCGFCGGVFEFLLVRGQLLSHYGEGLQRVLTTLVSKMSGIKVLLTLLISSLILTISFFQLSSFLFLYPASSSKSLHTSSKPTRHGRNLCSKQMM